jgi:hypothetical protein
MILRRSAGKTRPAPGISGRILYFYFLSAFPVKKADNKFHIMVISVIRRHYIGQADGGKKNCGADRYKNGFRQDHQEARMKIALTAGLKILSPFFCLRRHNE